MVIWQWFCKLSACKRPLHFDVAYSMNSFGFDVYALHQKSIVLAIDFVCNCFQRDAKSFFLFVFLFILYCIWNDAVTHKPTEISGIAKRNATAKIIVWCQLNVYTTIYRWKAYYIRITKVFYYIITFIGRMKNFSMWITQRSNSI